MSIRNFGVCSAQALPPSLRSGLSGVGRRDAPVEKSGHFLYNQGKENRKTGQGNAEHPGANRLKGDLNGDRANDRGSAEAGCRNRKTGF